MDVRKLEFEDKIFDIVLDKATMDCLFCSESSNLQVNKALSEIYRVLSANGTFFMISNGLPVNRQSHLEKFKWKVETFEC
jgi:ubiquinone/menaquinone biosynthesis C-methylase UbiE